MADAKQQGQARRAPESPPPVSAGRPIAVAITMIVVALAVFALPTFILVLAGMMPTVVAVIIDRDEGKPLGVSVGAMNLAGVWVYAVELWSGVGTISAALDLISNVYVWLLIYGAAAMGWLIYLGMPLVGALVLTISADIKIRRMRSLQEDLLEEWGAAVATVDAPAAKR